MRTGELSRLDAGRRRNGAIYAVAYIALGMVAVRELTARVATATLGPCLVLLAALALLTATDPLLFRRYPRYAYVYFPTATVLILALGWLPPYQDVWGILFVMAGVQARLYLSQRAALVWAGVSASAAFATFIVTFGPLTGLGDALTYLAASVLVVSWEALSSHARTSREASEALLAELQEAHARLQAYADDIEEQAALRERDRMAHQLHDSVGQTLFSITLRAESALLLLQKDEGRVSAHLERLENLTAGSAAPDALADHRVATGIITAFQVYRIAPHLGRGILSNRAALIRLPFARVLALLSFAQQGQDVSHSRSGFLTQLANQKVSGIAAKVTRVNLTNGGRGRLSSTN